MQGASPLASPALNRLRHRLNLRSRHPAGAYPPALPVDPVAVVLTGGACLFGRLPPLPLAFFVAPIPPPPFPGGEGGDQGYFMQGASPLASPALGGVRHLQTLPCRCSGADLARHRLNLRSRHPAGACPRRCRLTLSCRCPAAEPGRHCIDFGTAIPRGFAGARWFGQRQIQEKFLGVWGLLSRSPQCSSPPNVLLPHAPPVSAAHYGTRR